MHNASHNHTVKEITFRSPEGPTSFDVLMAMLQEMAHRQRRIETRLVRLMEAHNLDEFGQSKADPAAV